MSDSSVQVATVIISVTALVFSTTAAFWALVYNRRQARAASRADALTEKAQREQAEPYVIVDIRGRAVMEQASAAAVAEGERELLVRLVGAVCAGV
ncbi:hypothetical protein ACFVGY_10360 [Streptomyces sp. NPDC127106]|uniref:hypothetical protein n=1 Tax=Streptomyces sp. NPDC127106 TaxID=3345360 RepID=UPI0036349C7C